MKFTRRLTPVVVATLALAAPASAHEVEGSQSGMEWLLGSPPSGLVHAEPGEPDQEREDARQRVAHAADSTYRNSDLAFWGKRVYAGHYDGFQIVDASDPENPRQVVDFPCPGSQHDVSVWEDLLFVSVETPRTSPACDSTPTQSPGFEGIRIFDVSNPARPADQGRPDRLRLAHPHAGAGRRERPRAALRRVLHGEPLPESTYGNACLRVDENGERTTRSRSSRCRWTTRTRASVVSEPRFPQNHRTAHGWNGCHDISVYMAINRAASACMGEGQIWDISDKENPRTIARIHNPNVEFFHSATFSWDGKTVVFGDEAGGGTQPRCREEDAEHARRAVVLRRRRAST